MCDPTLYTIKANKRKISLRRRSPNFDAFPACAELVATLMVSRLESSNQDQATVPPTDSIDCRAPAVAEIPLRDTARVNTPVLITFTNFDISPTSPTCFNVSKSTSDTFIRSKSVNVISALYFNVVDLNPRLGNLR
jgi:hypothetical protein